MAVQVALVATAISTMVTTVTAVQVVMAAKIMETMAKVIMAMVVQAEQAAATDAAEHRHSVLVAFSQLQASQQVTTAMQTQAVQLGLRLLHTIDPSII